MIMQIIDINSPGITGGRRSSPKFRESLAAAEDFEGLPENVTHFDILKLVKRVGKEVGFTSRMIQLLEYYILFTKEQDWREGSRPIIYQSLYKTALDFGVGERQIQKLEQSLFEAGALTWNDSGNHKRYGTRSDNGDIHYAFGVDLSPLACLRSVLEQKYHEKQLRDAAWMETKRQISWYRAQIRALFGEIYCEYSEEALSLQVEYNHIAVPIRAYMSLESLRALRLRHKTLYNDVQKLVEPVVVNENDCVLSQKSSSTDALEDAHIYSTTYKTSDKSDTRSQKDTSFQKSVTDSIQPQSNDNACSKDQQEAILEPPYPKITLKQILNAASERFLERIPLNSKPMTETDFVDAAYALLPDLGVHKSAWVEACANVGRLGAAICIVIIDQKMHLQENRVRNPGGYLRAMAKRAEIGELNLHGSIFGLLKRDEQGHAA